MDASDSGIGLYFFWLHLGFWSKLPCDIPTNTIYFFEALAICATIHHIHSWHAASQFVWCLTILSDNTNAVWAFNTLKATPPYNPILISAVNVIIKDQLQVRIDHINGEDNQISDALSRGLLDKARKLIQISLFFTLHPLRMRWGLLKMNFTSLQSQQPKQLPWTTEHLVHKCSIALSHALAKGMKNTSNSALNSYLEFCSIHSFTIEPTEDTLSFYIIFMSHHIEPRSVDNYLSGICSFLEEYFLHILHLCSSALVSRTLKGYKYLCSAPIKQKRALTYADLQMVTNVLATHTAYDSLLFLAQLFTGFDALMHLSELVWPDNTNLCKFRKLSFRHSVTISDNSCSFLLPTNKSDPFFEGNCILLLRNAGEINVYDIFLRYLCVRDSIFPQHPELWIRMNDFISVHSWFIHFLHKFFPHNITGHSMHSGGATFLTEQGTPPSLIQAAGCWNSEVWQAYIRKHPLLLNAFLFANRQLPHPPAIWPPNLLELSSSLSIMQFFFIHSSSTSLDLSDSI